ncbi:MAG: tetratricopeptide repeat protein [Acidobacteriota bacterium]|nr:tetratricopeptide repeat protein [Acidobacteriota bacterium]
MFHFKFILLLVSSVCIGFTAISCSQSIEKHIARGEEYLQKRKFQEAVMEFRAAADIDKTSAAAYWGLARSFENLGQFYEASENLRRVAQLNPDNLEAKTKLGNYLLAGQPPQIIESEAILQDVFARNPNFIEAHILKASLFAAQKRSDKEILDVLNYAVALDPNRTETYVSLSRYLMKLDRRQEAEQTIQKGISVNPNYALGYLEYGRFLTFTGRAAQAEEQYKKAVEVEPANIEAREGQAEFYLAQRQFEQAEQSYKELITVEQNSPASRIKLGNFYAVVGRGEDALRIFSEIVAETPGYARARYRLGEIYLDRKENAKVTEQTDELLKLNESDTEALMLRARVRMQENRAEDAVADLEEILKKQPSQRNALFYITQARLALGQIDQARAFIGDLEKYHPNFLKTKLLKIQANFASGEPENALRQASELLVAVQKTYPDAELDAQDLEDLRVRALTARGLANLELGKLAPAKADLQAVQNLSPNSAAAMVNLAKVFVAEKNPTEAVNLYERALAADAKNFDALSGLINVLSRQKQFDQARGKMNQAIEANANRKEVLPALCYLNANVFSAQNDTEAAEAELKKAIEIDDAYLPAYSAYAAILVERNQTAEAIEEYKKVVGRKPSAAVYTLIGMLEEAHNNPAEAEKNYRRALEIAPETPIAANNLAWLMANNEGNLDEALTLAQSVVGKNQSIAGYYDTLGWIYYKKELYSPAVKQLKKAVALDQAEASRSGRQTTPAYRLRLGMALASAGDKPSARKEVATSLENGQSLSEKEMRDARNLLANL